MKHFPPDSLGVVTGGNLALNLWIVYPGNVVFFSATDHSSREDDSLEVLTNMP